MRKMEKTFEERVKDRGITLRPPLPAQIQMHELNWGQTPHYNLHLTSTKVLDGGTLHSFVANRDSFSLGRAEAGKMYDEVVNIASHTERPGIFIYGQPGIGKTEFQRQAIAQTLREKTPCLVLSLGSHYIIFREKCYQMRIESPWDLFNVAEELYSELPEGKTLRIFLDTNEMSTGSAREMALPDELVFFSAMQRDNTSKLPFFVITSSPSGYRIIDRLENRGLYFHKVIMNSWDEEELEVLCNDIGFKWEVVKETITDRYGNIPRNFARASPLKGKEIDESEKDDHLKRRAKDLEVALNIAVSRLMESQLVNTFTGLVYPFPKPDLLDSVFLLSRKDKDTINNEASVSFKTAYISGKAAAVGSKTSDMEMARPLKP